MIISYFYILPCLQCNYVAIENIKIAHTPANNRNIVIVSRQNNSEQCRSVRSGSYKKTRWTRKAPRLFTRGDFGANQFTWNTTELLALDGMSACLLSISLTSAKHWTYIHTIAVDAIDALPRQRRLDWKFTYLIPHWHTVIFRMCEAHIGYSVKSGT